MPPGGGVCPGATRSCSCAAGAPGGGVGGFGAAGGVEAAGGVGWLISGCACGVGAAGGAAWGGGGGAGCGGGAATGGGAGWGGGAAGGAGRGGGAAAGGRGGGGAATGGRGGGGAAAGGLAGAGAAFGGGPFGFGFPSGPSSSLACATTIGAVCACDAELANCITVKAEVASSTRRRCFMMIEIPWKGSWSDSRQQNIIS